MEHFKPFIVVVVDFVDVAVLIFLKRFRLFVKKIEFLLNSLLTGLQQRILSEKFSNLFLFLRHRSSPVLFQYTVEKSNLFE